MRLRCRVRLPPCLRYSLAEVSDPGLQEAAPPFASAQVGEPVALALSLVVACAGIPCDLGDASSVGADCSEAPSEFVRQGSQVLGVLSVPVQQQGEAQYPESLESRLAVDARFMPP